VYQLLIRAVKLPVAGPSSVSDFASTAGVLLVPLPPPAASVAMRPKSWGIGEMHQSRCRLASRWGAGAHAEYQRRETGCLGSYETIYPLPRPRSMGEEVRLWSVSGKERQDCALVLAWARRGLEF
jgi:hypothetical protein